MTIPISYYVSAKTSLRWLLLRKEEEEERGREGKEEQDAVAVDPSGVERWEGVQLPGRPRPQNIEMSGTSSE